jgi:amino acid adenylation domain-containing protein
VPVDDDMPKKRIELILENTHARYLIYDESVYEKVSKLEYNGELLLFDNCKKAPILDEQLQMIRETALDIDPIYILFTSGSTGIPKGVVGHHRGIIDYIDNLTEVLSFNETCIFGNQTPFYVDACLKEVYSTLKVGGTTWIIPKEYFMFPVKLIEYLNLHKINTICWVASALSIVSSFETFDTIIPKYLKIVSFGSEVFPVKQFNIWKKTLPDVKFYNLYGPTEASGVSCYYEADRLFDDKEVIPIGKTFRNTQIILLDNEGKEVNKGEVGEICIHGTCLTHGYYNNLEKTRAVFTQNPLNPNYPDIIYHSGDLGKLNAQSELIFVSRKDYQIKHMGHRIELGEIEANVSSIDKIKSCCCVFIKENKKIVLFYVGNLDKRTLTKEMKERLPRYMIPNSIIQLDALPLLSNGKMDRLKMRDMYINKNRSREKSGRR